MDNPFLAEFLIFGALALAWAGWELWSLRAPRESEKPPRHPEG